MTTKFNRPGLNLAGLAALCLGATLACTGVVTDDDEGPGANGGPNAGSGAGSGAGSSTGGAGTIPGQTLQGEDPGSKTMHRLNTTEYNYTVADTLGTTLAPATDLWLDEEDYGFDNIAKAKQMNDQQYQRYFDAASAVAEDVFANPTLKAGIVTCATEDSACVQSVISAVGLRLWRRPMAAEEITTFENVYNAAKLLGETHDNSLKATLRALLSSSEFLYRIETDPDPASLTPHAVGPYELASRASYFLWNSAPDQALLTAAADGSILDSTAFGAIVDSMYMDMKSDRFTNSFVGQWLGANKVANHGVKEEVYPTWSPALASSLAQEVYYYFNEFAKGDHPWNTFLTADINYIDANNAALYGMAAPAGVTRVTDTTDKRFGFLGMGAFLALSSYEYRTAPTLRGRWILINLLCIHPADPPPGVPPLDANPDDPNAAESNVRLRLEQHRTDPVCASCHSALDPYGIALENFDAIGTYRDAYKDGTLVDASTNLEGTDFVGLQGLADFVTNKAEFKSCVAEKLFTYGLGRAVEETDKPYLTNVVTEWQAGTGTIKDLVRRLMLADTFRFRRAAQ
jgi:hypothetical protein